jgi:hypothetical protein
MIIGHHNSVSSVELLAAQLAAIRRQPGAVIGLVWPVPRNPDWKGATEPRFVIVWTTDDGMPAKPGPRCTNCLTPIPEHGDGQWAAPTNHTLRADGSLQCNVPQEAC